MDFCPCCRNELKEKVDTLMFTGLINVSTFIEVPVCQKCYDAHERMRAREAAGEISWAQYKVYSDMLLQRIQRAILVGLFAGGNKGASADIHQLGILD